MTNIEPPILVCANHPGIETSLRCNKCEKPICPKCAVLTPTGYRCKECVRGQQKLFETATLVDYPLAFITAGVLSYIGSFVANWLGFFVLILAPIAGMIIAEAVRLVTRKRRSRWLFITAAAATLLGSLPNIILPLIYSLFTLASGGSFSGLGVFGISLLWHGLYTIMVTSTMYYRLSGIHLRM